MKKWGIWCIKTGGWVWEGFTLSGKEKPCLFSTKQEALDDIKEWAVDNKGYEPCKFDPARETSSSC